MEKISKSIYRLLLIESNLKSKNNDPHYIKYQLNLFWDTTDFILKSNWFHFSFLFFKKAADNKSFLEYIMVNEWNISIL